MQELFRQLSDFFFVTGTLCTGLGVLSMVSAAGGFDGLSYLFYSLRVRFSTSKTRWESRKSFYDYRIERQQKKKRSPKPFLTIGLIEIALAVVFAVLY